LRDRGPLDQTEAKSLIRAGEQCAKRNSPKSE
jgi:hypothetical protein